jgi:Flp pilus assembly protein TadG
MINPFRLRSRRRHGQRRRGATAIEFAMVAPAFLTVITVCAEFSRMCIMRNASQNACYEAARFVMTEGATVDDGIQRASSILGRLGNVQADITINGSDGTGDEIASDAQTVQVAIVIPLKDNAVILPGSMFGDNTIGAQVTLRTERYRGFYDSTSAD